jgi:hypothetical protein
MSKIINSLFISLSRLGPSVSGQLRGLPALDASPMTTSALPSLKAFYHRTPPCLLPEGDVEAAVAPSNAPSAARRKGTPSPPWTPTDQLAKRKVLTKRMGFLLQTLEAERLHDAKRERNFPDFKAGDILSLKLVRALFPSLEIQQHSKAWEAASS